MANRQESTISIPSKDPKKPEESKEGNEQKHVVADVKDPKNDDLTPEDQQLKQRLDLYVERLQDADTNVSSQALNMLCEEIRTSTSSMTSVPKPFKFIQPHYENIKKHYQAIIDPERKKTFADLMSILAMTMEDPITRSCLKYRLEGELGHIEAWGSQYVKHLAAEIRTERNEQLLAEDDARKIEGLIPMDKMMPVVEAIVKYYMTHNSESEACDLLLEVENLESVIKYCEPLNYEKVCLYLLTCAAYHPSPDDIHIFHICYDIFIKFKSYYHAMRIALRLDDKSRVHKVMKLCKRQKIVKRQIAFLLGWHQYNYEENDDDDDDNNNDQDIDVVMKDNENKQQEADQDEDDSNLPHTVNEIIANATLSEAFHNLARDLDIVDPKDPEVDVFKESLLDNTTAAQQQQPISARKTLAISYVNAFVNAGYGKDKYMASGNNKDADDWISKNKEHGKMAAVASVGSIMLWDEEASNAVDRYFSSELNYIRAGAYLAIGISCSGMRSEQGLGYALLSDPCSGKKSNRAQQLTPLERVAATFGLGLAYAGQANTDVMATLSQLVTKEESDELSSIASLCLGLVFVGTCNQDISNLIIMDLMEREKDKLNNPLYLLNVLGLGLLFLQKNEEVEVLLEACDAFNDINEKFALTLKTTLEALAYAGTGNVLKVQKFLEIIGEHFEEETKKDEKKDENSNEQGGMGNSGGAGAGGFGGIGGFMGMGGQDQKEDEENKEKEEVEDFRYHQSIAVLGISLIAISEDFGNDMALRMFNHIIQYGNQRVKRAVPLAIALLSVSNSKMEVSDILSKLSHDHDAQVSMNAILGLGIIGAGTNNARLAKMLRDLTIYYSKENNHLFIVRISQGLLQMGKGLLTLQPTHSDRFLLSKVAIGGILTLLFSCIDMKSSILGEKHYLLYSLVLAIKPRMLVTLDEQLKSLKTNVRVGQALDVVGVAGRPKTITGFQTHESPVLLQYKDRAELATDDYISYTPILEGFAILKPNPDSQLHQEKNVKKKK